MGPCDCRVIWKANALNFLQLWLEYKIPKEPEGWVQDDRPVLMHLGKQNASPVDSAKTETRQVQGLVGPPGEPL